MMPVAARVVRASSGSAHSSSSSLMSVLNSTTVSLKATGSAGSSLLQPVSSSTTDRIPTGSAHRHGPPDCVVIFTFFIYLLMIIFFPLRI